MKLDERFRVLPFCCFGTDKKAITNHIGKKGYFANRISLFNNIKLCKYGTLGTVLGDQQESFYMNETEETFSFFIPECLVKPKEKKYRPYTLMEFTKKFTIGQPIKFRIKGKVGCERYWILIGYQHEQYNEQTVTYINLGSGGYTLQELFEEYEFQEHYTEDFKPFGVEVEE